MAVRADDVDLIRDRSLVERCQAGDEHAFADLYQRYYARLLRFCTRRVGNVHEAEEITQEAFARAFVAMPRFAGERRFYPWLTVIASRLCIDSHRRVARTEPAAEVDPGNVEGGQQQILDNVDLAYLSEAMHRLGPRHREVLTLREAHGWSYQQIATHYDVTMGTVEALLFRARKALRREFLALAGDETRLAAIPVVGAALRGLASLRARVNDLSSIALPVAAASAASVAAIAGGLAMSVPSHNAAVHDARPAIAARLQADPALASRTSYQAPAHAAIKPSAAAAPTSQRPSSRTIAQGDAAAGHSRAADDSSTIHLAGFTLSTDFADAAALLNAGK